MMVIRYAPVLLMVVSAAAWAGETLGVGTEVAYTHDDNVTRGRGGYERADSILSTSINYTWYFPTTERTRLAVQPFVAGQYYFEYEQLSNGAGGITLQYQWRPGGGFYTPTAALFASAALEAYGSDLRDGASYRYGLSIHSPVTDRIGFYGALARSTRSADHNVFETENNAYSLQFDFAAHHRAALYVGFEYRTGDIVASTRLAPLYLNGAPSVWDDAFPGSGLYAYRTDGNAQLYNFGLNFLVHTGQAVDLSVRQIRSSVDLGYEYDVRQITLAWIGRF